MVTRTPMENFNRSNPFVIQAKTKYDELQTMYHDMMKLLVTIVIEFIVSVLIAGVVHFTLPVTTFPRTSVVIAIFVIVPVALYNLVVRYTVGDPKNESINKVVTMQMNEIMNINLEFVYDTILDMVMLQGKAQLAINILHYLRYTLAFINVLLCVLIGL